MKTIGVMVDCSRNAVRNIDSLKRMVDYLKLMKMNRFYLYLEDIYTIDSEPYFGHLRGKYSKNELRSVVEYGAEKGIEVVPCFQTLAHLQQLFQWEKFYQIKDVNEVLLVGDQRTYELIDKMFATMADIFPCEEYNAGMDEAFMLGLGKYLTVNGVKDKIDIFMEHLSKVNEIAKKYGKKVAIWSDMVFRTAFQSEDYYVTRMNINEKFLSKVPNDVTLIYWDYYHTDYKTYDMMLKKHKKFSNKISFAGGNWTWTGFAPNNRFAIKTLKQGIKAAVSHNLDDIILTCWGDEGGECLLFSAIPSLFYASELFHGVRKLSDIKKDFYKTFNIKFDQFLKLDLPNALDKENILINPCKYLLYNDPFLRVLDSTLSGDEDEKYAIYARKIKSASKSLGEFSYLGDTLSSLSKVLSVKACLGLKTKEAYDSKNIELLSNLIKRYKLTIKYLNIFIKDYKIAWFKENKSFGFEVQEYRLAGLKYRLESCAERLQNFIDGKIDRIEELEQPVLDIDGKSDYNLKHKHRMYNDFKTSVTLNKI